MIHRSGSSCCETDGFGRDVMIIWSGVMDPSLVFTIKFDLKDFV